MRPTLVLALVVVVGCGGDPSPSPDAMVEPPDTSGLLYEPNHVVEVAITMAEADWDALRKQTRSASEVFGTCPTGPHTSPFTQFHATATVDGVTLGDVAIRKKGFYGSLDEDKPSLRIKTDAFVVDQEIYSRNSLTLNNSKQDASLIQQCLAYEVFAKAGVPASRCNFARVSVNGRALGIYVNVEGVGKRMLRRHFSDDEGNLYEGAISDFRAGWSLTFEKKTNEADLDRSDLDAVSTALTRPDAELLAAVDPLVDVEEFLDYWAAEVLIGHTDSYSGLANNFFVYRDPSTGRFSFLPWGVDNTFHTGGVINQTNDAVAANGLLARRLYLYPPTRDRYLARLKQHLAMIWNETELLAEIDRMAALVAPPAAEVEAVRMFVRERRAAIDNALVAGPPAWTAPFKASAKPCFETNGTSSGTFQTTWGTLGAADVFAAGTGTLSGTIENLPLGAATRVGSAAGNDSGGRAIQIYGQNSTGTISIIAFNLAPSLFTPGDHSLGFGAVQIGAGAYLFTPASNTIEALGIVASGNLHLDSAGTTTNAAVRGSYTLSTLRLPF